MPNRDMVDYMDVERVEEEKKTITSDLENVESPVSYSNPKEQQEQNSSDLQVGSFGIIEKLESCQNMAPQNQQHDTEEVALQQTTEIFNRDLEDSLREDQQQNQSVIYEEEESSFVESK